jgi:hypothetical protein
MSKKYKIKNDVIVFYKKKRIINETLTKEIAEELLATGQYDGIIEVIESKKKKENVNQE